MALCSALPNPNHTCCIRLASLTALSAVEMQACTRSTRSIEMQILRARVELSDGKSLLTAVTANAQPTRKNSFRCCSLANSWILIFGGWHVRNESHGTVSLVRSTAFHGCDTLYSLSRLQLRLQFPDAIVPGVVCVPLCVRQCNKLSQFQSLKLPLKELNQLGADFSEVSHWLMPVDVVAPL